MNPERIPPKKTKKYSIVFPPLIRIPYHYIFFYKKIKKYYSKIIYNLIKRKYKKVIL
jgi:hypothetical protein